MNWHEISIDAVFARLLCWQDSLRISYTLILPTRHHRRLSPRPIMNRLSASPPSAPRERFRNRRDALATWMRGASALLLLCAGAPVARAGVLTWGPVLDVELREDELPGVAAREHGWVARLSPQISLLRTGTSSTLELSGLRSFASHREFTGPERAGDAATLRFRAEPSTFTKWTTNASYLSTRDPLGHSAFGPATFSE